MLVVVDCLAQPARFNQQLYQQRMGRFIERIHLEPTAGRRDAQLNLARSQRILPQLIVGGDHLPANLFASQRQPLIELGRIGQVEVGQEVAVIGGQGVVEGGRFFGRVNLAHAGHRLHQGHRIDLPALRGQGHGFRRDDQLIADFFSQAGQDGAQIGQRLFRRAALPQQIGQKLAPLGLSGVGQIDQ